MSETPVILLALDPSSTCTGYAVWRAGELHAAGLLRPPAKLPAEQRVWKMIQDLITISKENRPTHAVIEIPDAHIARRCKQWGGAGMALYGMAAGMLYVMTCTLLDCRNPNREYLAESRVTPVRASEWTGGSRKRLRQRLVAAELPQYDAAADRGADAADAIALGRWWMRRAATQRRSDVAT
jgi:Holliday junction resolvasome RuvABC endonuclease subunit